MKGCSGIDSGRCGEKFIVWVLIGFNFNFINGGGLRVLVIFFLFGWRKFILVEVF